MLLHTDASTHRCFSTQTFLHTQMPLPTEALTNKRLYTQNATHLVLKTPSGHNLFWHISLQICIENAAHPILITPLGSNLFVQILLQICSEHVHHLILIPFSGAQPSLAQFTANMHSFTHRRFNTQTPLHTGSFPHTHFYTHTHTFTHRRF